MCSALRLLGGALAPSPNARAAARLLLLSRRSMPSAAEAQGRADVFPAPARPPCGSPAPRRALPSVVTWRVPDIAAVLLLEVEPRKVLVQCHYLKSLGPNTASSGGGAGGGHSAGGQGDDESEEGEWAEEWSFPFVVLPTGRAGNTRELVRAFRECLGLAVEIVSEVDTGPFQDRQPSGARGGSTPCRLYRARIAMETEGAVAPGVQDTEEHTEEGHIANGTQESVGAEHDLLMKYTRVNTAVAEVGAIEIGQLTALNMSLMHRRCRLACWNAFLSDAACMGGKANVTTRAYPPVRTERNVTADPWTHKALSAGEVGLGGGGVVDDSGTADARKNSHEARGHEKVEIVTRSGDNAEVHASRAPRQSRAVGGQMRGTGTGARRGDRGHIGLGRRGRGSQLQPRVERGSSFRGSVGRRGWGRKDPGRTGGIVGWELAERRCEDQEHSQGTAFLTWVAHRLQQALQGEGISGEHKEGRPEEQRFEADVRVKCAAAYVQEQRQVRQGGAGMESFVACLQRLLEDEVTHVAADASAREERDGGLANTSDAFSLGPITAAVAHVARKAAEAGEASFGVVHRHSARAGQMQGERRLELANDGPVVTKLAASRHLFLRQVGVYTCRPYGGESSKI